MVMLRSHAARLSWHWLLKKTKTRNKRNTLYVLLCLTFLVNSSHAQFLKGLNYKGLDVSFGTRSFTVSSDIPELKNLAVLEEGGQVGVILGKDAFRVRAGVAGFFYSANRVGRTVDLFESDLTFHYYIFEKKYSHRIIQPYFTGGMVYNKTKFYGNFLHSDNPIVNYSSTREPLLGAIHQFRGAVGGGIEIKVLNNDFHFAHIFIEAKYAAPLTSSRSKEVFANTTLSGQLMLNVGIRFGGRDEIY